MNTLTSDEAEGSDGKYKIGDGRDKISLLKVLYTLQINSPLLSRFYCAFFIQLH